MQVAVKVTGSSKLIVFWVCYHLKHFCSSSTKLITTVNVFPHQYWLFTESTNGFLTYFHLFSFYDSCMTYVTYLTPLNCFLNAFARQLFVLVWVLLLRLPFSFARFAGFWWCCSLIFGFGCLWKLPVIAYQEKEQVLQLFSCLLGFLCFEFVYDNFCTCNFCLLL